MKTQGKYNNEDIEKAVESLKKSIKMVREELSSEKYQEVISNLEATVESLDEADRLLPVLPEIRNQIIDPVSKQLKKSSKSNRWFGWVGIGAAVLGIFVAVFFGPSSGDVAEMRDSLSGVASDLKGYGSSVNEQIVILKTNLSNITVGIKKHDKDVNHAAANILSKLETIDEQISFGYAGRYVHSTPGIITDDTIDSPSIIEFDYKGGLSIKSSGEHKPSVGILSIGEEGPKLGTE